MLAPVTNPLTVTEVGLLAVYAACLCTSLHLMEPSRLLETGYTQESRASATADLSLLMGTCFHFGDLSQRHRLEFIQAYM
jgi:hypothetical protein